MSAAGLIIRTNTQKRYYYFSRSICLLVLLLVLVSTPISAEPTTPPPVIAKRDLKADAASNAERAERPRPSSKRPEYIAHPAGDLVCRPFGESSSAEDAANGVHVGEVPAWESCGKVIKNERQNFWEFVTANLLFLIVALTVLWARTSALATEQYRQLAARIGIPSGTWAT
ncbi:hypothetical protein I316_05760 [Kwoniella heveanensis BCC8398]|uniref:Uncharacterized protein n=1 Tax=Kwoniella heveanensis BCC8398 TaxID=1296120 RepID=A0A1B9GND8_9TREE|nr:hypothetical protein I316_05760 [Kwoniella heveanensis BCC8398]